MVYIILLNWNGWKDTIECLESLLLLNYKKYKVIVCDNNSEDDSLEKIKKWAIGKMNTDFHSVMKIDRREIKYLEVYVGDFHKKKGRNVSLILISIGKNLGFAGGTNIGIRYALKDPEMEYVWILNNDTVVKEDTLDLLVEKIGTNKNIGICGSRLMEYDFPRKIQGLGGKYNKFLGTTKHILEKKELDKLDYVIGASMLVSRRFIEETGLMNEEYFLYFEELDWAIRAQKNFQMACSCESVVYHKGGSSTGGNKKSRLSDYYIIRSKILFTKKYFPAYLITIYISLLYSIFNRMRRGQYGRALMILKIAYQSIFKKSIDKYSE